MDVVSKIKTIHAIWLGSNLPPLAHVCIDDWRKQGYHYKLWLDSDSKIKEWINGCEFSRKCYAKGLYAFVTDYLRLKILAEEGGLYLDTDVTINRDPFELLQQFDFGVGYEDGNKIGTAIIYAREKSPTLARLINFYEREIMSSELYMGPDVMTYLINKEPDGVNVGVLEKHFFYDYSGESLHYFPHPERVLTHWFQHSWKRSRGLIFLKSKSKGLLGKLYEYQKDIFRCRGRI